MPNYVFACLLVRINEGELTVLGTGDTSSTSRAFGALQAVLCDAFQWASWHALSLHVHMFGECRVNGKLQAKRGGALEAKAPSQPPIAMMGTHAPVRNAFAFAAFQVVPSLLAVGALHVCPRTPCTEQQWVWLLLLPSPSLDCTPTVLLHLRFTFRLQH